MDRMHIRMGTLDDEASIKEIFHRQGLKVDLPFASTDPSVAFTLVGEEHGEVKIALIGRVGLEIHLVASPDDEHVASRVRQLSPVAEGITIKLSHDLVRHGWPAITDAEAFVPKGVGRMDELMRLVGFRPGNDERFDRWYKVIGGRK